MDDNCEYIQPRRVLIQHFAKYGMRDLSTVDQFRAKDATTKLVKTWMETREKEMELRRATLLCVTFTTKSKIEVHDTDGLEILNTQISALVTHRMVMEAAIEKLSIDAPAFLCDLRTAREKAQETVAGAPRAINFQLGSELRYSGAATVEEAQQRPRYLKTKEEYEASAAAAKSRLEEIEPMIGLIEAQLAACEI